MQTSKKLILLYSSLFNEGQISDPSKGLYGAGAHTDYGLITLLATDDVAGLQVRKQMIFFSSILQTFVCN